MAESTEFHDALQAFKAFVDGLSPEDKIAGYMVDFDFDKYEESLSVFGGDNRALSSVKGRLEEIKDDIKAHHDKLDRIRRRLTVFDSLGRYKRIVDKDWRLFVRMKVFGLKKDSTDVDVVVILAKKEFDDEGDAGVLGFLTKMNEVMAEIERVTK